MEHRREGLDLPPVYRLVTLREHADAFAHALSIGAQEGAGTLVWVRRFDVMEVAVVLEPEEPLANARRAIYAGLCALADALAIHCPPEKPIEFAWPDAVMFDKGLIGGGRIGWPKGTREDDVPEFLVFGAMLRTFVSARGETGVSARGETGVSARGEAGTWASGTSLEHEGFETIDIAALVESFARHLMVHVHAWQDRGFKQVGEQWLARLPRIAAERRGIAENGDLLLRPSGATSTEERRALAPLLAQPTWLDPQTGMPWL